MRRLYIFGYDIYLLSIVIMIINLKYAQTYQTSTLTIYFKTFILHSQSVFKWMNIVKEIELNIDGSIL